MSLEKLKAMREETFQELKPEKDLEEDLFNDPEEIEDRLDFIL